MAKVTAFSPTDRLAERDGDTAAEELDECVLQFLACLEHLAQDYPGVIACGSIVCGRPCGVFAMTSSAEGGHYSPLAPQVLRTLAQIVGRLPAELRAAFEAELRTIARPEPEPPEAGESQGMQVM